MEMYIFKILIEVSRLGSLNMALISRHIRQ